METLAVQHSEEEGGQEQRPGQVIEVKKHCSTRCTCAL